MSDTVELLHETEIQKQNDELFARKTKKVFEQTSHLNSQQFVLTFFIRFTTSTNEIDDNLDNVGRFGLCLRLVKFRIISKVVRNRRVTARDIDS